VDVRSDIVGHWVTMKFMNMNQRSPCPLSQELNKPLKEVKMKTTTLNNIRKHDPCANGWEKLLKYLGKTQADDDPLPYSVIVESNGLDDALWCCRAEPRYDSDWRLYAVWCARQVQHLMSDERSVAALDVAERHATGQATDEELESARAAAWAAAEDAARVAAKAAGDAARAAGAAARAAAGDAAWEAARVAAWAAEDAARVAAKAAEDAAWEAARVAAKAAWDAAGAAAWAAGAAAWAAAGAAAWAAQKQKFLEIVREAK
jgi:hypothetical protein